MSTTDQVPSHAGARTDSPANTSLGEQSVRRSGARELTLRIPELFERPAIGAGCCALWAAAEIATRIEELDGVERASPSEDEEDVIVVVPAKDSSIDMKAVRAAVESLDYKLSDDLGTR